MLTVRCPGGGPLTMDERKRLAVAVGLPMIVLAAMLFAPLDAVARRDGPVESDQGALGAISPSASESSEPKPRRSTPVPATAESYDWADVVQVGGITYSAGLLYAGRALRDEDLGSEIAQVTAKLNGNVKPLGYALKDGDAAYLEPGTSLYAVNGYRPTFRLAARRGGRPVLFEAVANPSARFGRDLLDIEGKVRSIALDASDPRAVSRSIDRSDDVSSVVAMILDAQVQSKASFGERTAYISLRLVDGTAVTFQFSEESGNLSRGIVGLPREFATAIAVRP